MSQSDAFAVLMSRLRAGDDQACAEVFGRFAEQLLRLTRQRLPDSLRPKLDPEDVLQSAFRSFFTRCREGRFDPANWDNLWGLLSVIALRKCGRRIEYFQTAGRDPQRERPLHPGLETDEQRGLHAREPSPPETAVLAETLERLTRGFEGWEREVLTLHLQAYTIYEISARVGRCARTVRRTLERVRNRLRRMQETE
jgi:RNA polymerase sigma-70 factor (ECF subfamily)